MIHKISIIVHFSRYHCYMKIALKVGISLCSVNETFRVDGFSESAFLLDYKKMSTRAPHFTNSHSGEVKFKSAQFDTTWNSLNNQ